LSGGFFRDFIGFDPFSEKFSIYLSSVSDRLGNYACHVFLVYGSFHANARKDLSEHIKVKWHVLKDNPWILVGDYFNIITDLKESTSTSDYAKLDIEDFVNYLNIADLFDHLPF
jgi:hypothetical protein